MIWLTWRQLRSSAALTGAVLAALALLLLVTGRSMAADYDTGIAACTASGQGCLEFGQRFFKDHEVPFMWLSLLVLLLPGLLGLFWGAPLVAREVEAGTHQLVWSQSVTRTRWLAVKLAVTGAVVMVAAGLASLVVSWWVAPLDEAGAARDLARLAPMFFAGRGIVPVTYTAFAFVLGVALGTIVRKTVPAMALTLVVFGVVQVAEPILVRPHLMTPEHATVEIDDGTGFSPGPGGDGVRLVVDSSAVGDPGAWIRSNHTVGPDGQRVDAIFASDVSCELPGGPEGATVRQVPKGDELPACLQELRDLGYRQEFTYFPADRFWTFQWIESALFLALSAILAAACFWTLRRRLA
jgi:ABC-type transport system involved in multi-copper enzyme maturation permease subunit